MDLGSAPTPMKNSGYTTVSLCVQKVDTCCQPEKDGHALHLKLLRQLLYLMECKTRVFL